MNPYSTKPFIVVRGMKIIPCTNENYKSNYVLYKGSHYDCRKYIREYPQHAEMMRIIDRMFRIAFTKEYRIIHAKHQQIKKQLQTKELCQY